MWHAKVLTRKRDTAGYIYHAYAVSNKGVHDLEGRYSKRVFALDAARSLANAYNKNQVNEDNPFEAGVLAREQCQRPWRKPVKPKKGQPSGIAVRIHSSGLTKSRPTQRYTYSSLTPVEKAVRAAVDEFLRTNKIGNGFTVHIEPYK